MLTSPQLSHLKHLLGYMACFLFTAQQVTPVATSSMPCSRCGSWEGYPSWHRCENTCVNEQGTATLHSGEEIRCSKSWDDKWWFFFCNRCKNATPRIRGVLRGARLYLRMEHAHYITDSENDSCITDSENDSTPGEH